MGPFPIRAVIAFHQMNHDLPLHQHGLVFWLIHHLYRDFDLEKGFWNLNQYPRSRDKALSTMKEKILQKLFRACEHFYAPFPNGPSRESGTELIEAVLVWFLEFERSAPIILVKDRQRKVLWWRMRHVFGVDIGLGKDGDDGGNEAVLEFDWPLSNSTTGRGGKS